MNIITPFEIARRKQQDIDNILVYKSLSQTIELKISTYIPKYRLSTRNTKKLHKNNKLYCNKELQTLWNTMQDSENHFL